MVYNMVKVEVFTSPMCPHCPAAKRVVEEVASEIDGIEVEYIDAMKEPERAAKYGIMAVPTIVIDGEVTFIGAPTKEALVEEIKKKM
ncbi:redox-active disulfide protein 1 [Methanotorris formicicus Mc-S-70]|uniref:Redox-active disulfide protein 1 n=2 Tax=Methanotorris formicicus TaxID=213185 RepID=H1L1M4_9EURY|nr:redox-active disulfide protein 1 [Methanotorris formicicus Mc-S-70]